MQVGSARRLCPANILIPAFERPRCRRKGQRSKITMYRTFNNISNLSTAQRTAAKIVVLIQKRKPNLGFFAIAAGHRINSYLSQLLQSTLQFSYIRFNRDGPSVLETVCFLLRRQIHKAALMQLCQSFSAAHIL